MDQLEVPDLHLAPVLVLPGEHTLLLHQHLPKGPHFLSDLLFGVPGWAKMWSGLLWLEYGPAEELHTEGPIKRGGGMVAVIRAWRTAGSLLISCHHYLCSPLFCLLLTAVLGRGRDIRKGRKKRMTTKLPFPVTAPGFGASAHQTPLAVPPLQPGILGFTPSIFVPS